MRSEPVLDLNRLSLKELERLIGRPPDNVLVSRGEIVAEFSNGCAAFIRVHIATKTKHVGAKCA